MTTGIEPEPGGHQTGTTPRSRNATAILWVAVYLLLVSAPLILLLAAPRRAGSGFWWDLSMALGFAGMAVMGLQFALTARFRKAEAPFGIDIVYYFHRIIAIAGIALVLVHVGILWAGYPAALGVRDPLEAPAYMTAGRVSLLLFLVVIVTSLWRRPLRIDYDHWRMMHALLATLAFLLAVVHIDGVGYYIDGPAKRALWIGYTSFWVFLIVYVRAIKPVQMLRSPYRIVENRPEHGETRTLTLVPEGHAGLRFMPGQFAWLTLRGRPFRFHEHPFSFSGNAEDSQRLQFSIKALGDFTGSVGAIQPGETAWVDGPYGVFSIDRYPEAAGAFFVAAGVGIAPIMSMLRTLAARNDARPLTLLYANVDWDQVIFRDELVALQARLHLRLVHVLERPPADWGGESGRITQDMVRALLPAQPDKLQYFLCGPKPVCESVQRWLHAAGVPLSSVHFELFDMV